MDINELINLCINYIKNNIEDTGKFNYLVNLKSDVLYDSYNEVRHAGIIYSVNLYEKIYNSNILIQEKKLASDYLINNLTKRLDSGLLLPYNTRKNSISLGGIGLSITALYNLYQQSITVKHFLDDSYKFALSLQKPDGSFYHRFNLNDNSIDKEAYCLYFDGEFALGLLYLYEVTKSIEYFYLAKNIILRITNENKPEPFNHWIFIAAKKLIELDGNLTEDEKYSIQRLLIKSINLLIFQQNIDKNSKYFGALKGNIRPCSIATILEGMIAGYNLIDNTEIKSQLKQFIDNAMEFLINIQIKEGKFKGGFPAQADWNILSEEKYSRIRIDFIQHVLSAALMYYETFNAKIDINSLEFVKPE